MASYEKLKNSYAFVVEGQTEDIYIQMLKRHEKLNIKMACRQPNKKNLNAYIALIKELDSQEYTKIFWILDLDFLLKEQLEKSGDKKTALEKLKDFKQDTINTKLKTPVEIIINNPCIEIWFLLHYEEAKASFSRCDKAEKALKKHLKSYEKSQKYLTRQNQDIYKQLKDGQNNAIKIAKSMGEFDFSNCNKPVCEMYKIFSQIVELQEI